MSSQNDDQSLKLLEQRIEHLEIRIAATRVRDKFEQVSQIFPKERTVIFNGREYFGDNIKYAYLSFLPYALANGINCWFQTDREQQFKQLTAAGLPCLPWFVPEWSAEQMRILLSAKVVVTCNVFSPIDERAYFPYSLLSGARTVQLWHGVPLKAIGMECLYPARVYQPRIADTLAASGPFDVFVGGAAAAREDWARRFSFHDYAPIGWPRTDVLLRDAEPHDLLNVDMDAYAAVKLAAGDHKPVILYAPTFRDHKFGLWFESVGVDQFAAHCEAAGWLFCVNLHPMEAVYIDQYRARFPKILFINAQADIYPIARFATVLITDYSSLAFDYLILDRPIVFYRPDHADYIKFSRPLIAGAEDYLCGPVAETVPSLIDSIVNLLSPGGDMHRSKRKNLQQKIYDQVDGHAGERLNALILRELDR